eukprot:TRINITY_DN10383_c0_g3_i1.p5 TRINITY_DN10383_c0_g3~~TRINITY_DN10383_c0_g3_i1.p5  ORF type:complete len:163 (-),score=16.97 TRINITY_DN10383_c0_g3_i1:1851-2339(-)
MKIESVLVLVFGFFSTFTCNTVLAGKDSGEKIHPKLLVTSPSRKTLDVRETSRTTNLPTSIPVPLSEANPEFEVGMESQELDLYFDLGYDIFSSDLPPLAKTISSSFQSIFGGPDCQDVSPSEVQSCVEYVEGFERFCDYFSGFCDLSCGRCFSQVQTIPQL